MLGGIKSTDCSRAEEQAALTFHSEKSEWRSNITQWVQRNTLLLMQLVRQLLHIYMMLENHRAVGTDNGGLVTTEVRAVVKVKVVLIEGYVWC